MILTGKQIIEALKAQKMIVEPFNPKNVGPCSYDVRMADSVSEIMPNAMHHGRRVIDTHLPSRVTPVKPQVNGAFLLFPGHAYLGHTMEIVGSMHYVPLMHGRSTTARHGLLPHFAAGFGDIGFFGQWVLEIANMTHVPMLVYPGDRIAQISFETFSGDVEISYKSTYQNQKGITPGKSLGD